MSDHVLVTAGAVLDNGTHGELPLTANFVYNPADPVAVSMTLILDVELDSGHMARDQSTWTFGRGLLDTALSSINSRTVGDGDVTVTYYYGQNLLRLQLTDVHGQKHALYVDAEPVQQFMEQSLRMVPADRETVDVDTAIEKLLDGTWQS